MSRSGGAAASMPVRGPSGEGAERTERMTHMLWQAERVQQLDPANTERAMRAMFGLGRCLDQSGLEPSLLDLVAMRASQINGCAYCLDMHTKDARALRGRAAAVPARGLARVPFLQRAGARGAALDRGRHAD